MSSVPDSMASGGDFAWEVATLYPPQGAWTEGEYLQLTDSINRFIEFTDGHLEFLAMPTVEHQLIIRFLLDSLRGFVEPRELGTVLFAVLRVYIREGKYREPDLIFKFAENHAKCDGRYYKGADLVMEVVSDDDHSHERDYDTKVLDYAEAKIPEYWIVDPQAKKITVLALEGDKYVEHCVAKTGMRAESRLLEGFVVDADAVFAAGKQP